MRQFDTHIGTIAVASPDWPARYYLMRELWKFGARPCGVSSAAGLEYLVHERSQPPQCAIVDEALCEQGCAASRWLRRVLGGIPLVILGRSPACETPGGLSYARLFDYRLEAPADPQQIGDLLCWLCETRSELAGDTRRQP